MAAKRSSKKSLGKRGRIVILSAPSGAGKSTIVRRLLRRHPGWRFSISATTRMPRPGERDGREYYFLTPAAFEAMRKRGGFVEWARVHTDRYGTPKAPLEEALRKGETILLDIDVQGERQVRRMFPEAVSIFILAPSWEELKRRLQGRRTEDRNSYLKRLEDARKEMRALPRFDYVVINEDLGRAVKSVESLISAARHRTRFFLQSKGGRLS